MSLNPYYSYSNRWGIAANTGASILNSNMAQMIHPAYQQAYQRLQLQGYEKQRLQNLFYPTNYVAEYVGEKPKDDPTKGIRQRLQDDADNWLKDVTL